MTPETRERLAKILGMLGSEHDGEVLNAGRQAEAVRREAGLTWVQIIHGQEDEEGEVEDEFATRWQNWRVAVEFCVTYKEILTDNQVDFVYNIRAYCRRPTDKQCHYLASLTRKIEDYLEAA